MEINRDYHIEEAAESRRDGLTRPTLQHVYIGQNGQGPVAVACNGFILACVPVEADQTEVGLYQTKTFKAARQAKASLPVTIVPNGDNETVTLPFAGGITMPRCDDATHANYAYPRYEELTRARQPNAVVIGLKVTHLERLAKALGTDEVALIIDPEIVRGLGKPIIVLPRENPVVAVGEKPTPPYALLMPMVTK